MLGLNDWVAVLGDAGVGDAASGAAVDGDGSNPRGTRSAGARSRIALKRPASADTTHPERRRLCRSSVGNIIASAPTMQFHGREPPCIVEEAHTATVKPLPSPIRFGSMFSGMGMDMIAAKDLNRAVVHEFWVESDAGAQRFLRANGTVRIEFYDAYAREFRNMAPAVDVLTLGAPCTPFSTMGKNLALNDDRGAGMFTALPYIERWRPRIIIFENVPTLLTKHAAVFARLVSMVKAIVQPDGAAHYATFWKALNSADYGVPQRRTRLYLICIAYMGRTRVRFRWPNAEPPVTLKSILDVDDNTTPPERLTGATALRNLALANDKVLNGTYNGEVCVDLQSSTLSLTQERTPCLTRARGKALAFWLLRRNRRLTTREMCRLQGIDVEGDGLHIPCTHSQLGGLLGNAFTRCVMSKLIAQAVLAAEHG